LKKTKPLNLEISHRNASSKEEIIIGKITHWIGKSMIEMHYPRRKWGMKNSAIQQKKSHGNASPQGRNEVWIIQALNQKKSYENASPKGKNHLWKI
jgi:hypothetical protein